MPRRVWRKFDQTYLVRSIPSILPNRFSESALLLDLATKSTGCRHGAQPTESHVHLLLVPKAHGTVYYVHDWFPMLSLAHQSVGQQRQRWSLKVCQNNRSECSLARSQVWRNLAEACCRLGLPNAIRVIDRPNLYRVSSFQERSCRLLLRARQSLSQQCLARVPLVQLRIVVLVS